MNKTCPYCTEEVKEEAIKCKHCGSDLRERPVKDYFNNFFQRMFGQRNLSGGLKGKIEDFFQRNAPKTRLINIRRLPEKGLVFGVCEGIAAHYNWNANLVRLLTVFILLGVAGGFFGVLLYLVIAYVMPTASVS